MTGIRLRYGAQLEPQRSNQTGLIEMDIGKWYDPISERWFVPREVASLTGCPRRCLNGAPEVHGRSEAQRVEVQRIWELLVDCCAHR